MSRSTPRRTSPSRPSRPGSESWPAAPTPRRQRRGSACRWVALPFAVMREATSGSGRRAVIGRDGEEAAARAYRRAGFKVLARNWRCPAGELDLVLAGRGLVVFCEVKTRSSDRFGGGVEAVTWRKQRKIRQLAELFLASSRLRPAGVRFDVASVGPGRDGPVTVELFEDAF